MRCELQLLAYALPLRAPWASARGTLTTRRGWLIQAAADGLRGHGDCAPLPAAGTETPDLAWTRLTAWRALARERPVAALLEQLAPGTARSPAPAADCAVETALLDLQARAAGQPLRDLLASGAHAEIAVNAALGTLSSASLAPLERAQADGYRVFKLKLGVAPLATELRLLDALARHLSARAALRLDANGAWDTATARLCIETLASNPDLARAIEALEEPLRAPNDAELADLQTRAPFALALDESLTQRPWPIDPGLLPARRLVLKPATLGGPRITLALARAALAAGREVVLTSLLESAAGLWATAQLAAALPLPPDSDGLAHGLATGAWLARDLGAPPLPRAGRLRLPTTAGSGFEPSPDAPSAP